MGKAPPSKIFTLWCSRRVPIRAPLAGGFPQTLSSLNLREKSWNTYLKYFPMILFVYLRVREVREVRETPFDIQDSEGKEAGGFSCCYRYTCYTCFSLLSTQHSFFSLHPQFFHF